MSHLGDDLTAMWNAVGWDAWGREGGLWTGDAAPMRDHLMGGNALARGHNDAAEVWLKHGAARGHPGAVFRLALVYLRAGTTSKDKTAIEALDRAAALGHGDAERIMCAWDFYSDGYPSLDRACALIFEAADNAQDPAFAAEVAYRLTELLSPS
ncbi:hypothetical protein AB0I68_26110 [Streptomyces sp. NPDC050448]|uniref:hypothetical protein n=1 Tax=Streptomyces sp. NPDC050448 TaxID=3155404 RepID=UPI00342D92B0